MAFLDSMAGVFTSILSGGATGIIGVAVQRIADYKNKQLDVKASAAKYGHELEMKKVDLSIMEKEYAGRLLVAQTEAAGIEAQADSQAFAASYKEPALYSKGVTPSGGQGWVLVLLDFIRGIVRPGLTVYLCLVTTLVYLHSREMLDKTIPSADQAAELVKLCIQTVLYLTTTCVLWWFGTRNKQPAPKGK